MSSIKCPKCNLINFSSDDLCKRCGEPFSKVRLTEVETNLVFSTESVDRSKSPNKIKIDPVWIVVGVVLLLLTGLFINKQMGIREAARQIAEKKALEKETGDRQYNQNISAAHKALDPLKRVSSAVDGGLNFTQYSDMVVSLKVETDAALRSFVIYGDRDSDFKSSIESAANSFLRARDLWHTSIRYNSVTSEDEKTEWLNQNWDSARRQIEIAELNFPKQPMYSESLQTQ